MINQDNIVWDDPNIQWDDQDIQWDDERSAGKAAIQEYLASQQEKIKVENAAPYVPTPGQFGMPKLVTPEPVKKVVPPKNFKGTAPFYQFGLPRNMLIENKTGGKVTYDDALRAKFEAQQKEALSKKEIERSGSLEEPWMDPITVGVAAATGGASLALKGGSSIGKALLSGGIRGLIGAAEEVPIGVVTEIVAEEHPQYALPLNLALGLFTGFTFGGFEDEAVKRLSSRAGSAPDKVAPKVSADMFSERFMGKAAADGAETVSRETGTTLYGGLPIQAVAKWWEEKGGGQIWDWGVGAVKKIPGVNRALIREYRGNLPNSERYIEHLDDLSRGKSIGYDYAIDLGKRLQSVSEVEQLALGEYIRGARTNLPANIKPLGDEAKGVLYKLGKDAVDTGLLDEETFFRNAGRYMPRLYTSKEYQTKLNAFGLKKPTRLDLTRFKRRSDIPKEIREQMGEILTPGYPVAKGVAQLTHDIEQAKFFNGVASMEDWAVAKGAERAIPDGFVQLPDNKKLGKLSGAFVHPEIAADVNETIRVLSDGEKAWRKALGAWKYGKVIISPKTHVRNMMSNTMLSHLGGLPMWEQPVYLTKAWREMAGKGELWEAAKREGLLSNTFVHGELFQLFENTLENDIRTIPEAVSKLGNVAQKAKILGSKAADLYEAEEQWFKMAKFIHNVNRRGMDYRQAAVDAEKWLFNYNKLTRFQSAYRTHYLGAPFGTFTFKAMPRVLEAAVKTPWRFAPVLAMYYALDQASMDTVGDTEEEYGAKKELRESWMQGGFPGMPNFQRIPFKGEDGREFYLDLSYIMPWGDIAERGGAFGILPGGISPLTQPGIKELIDQIRNRDEFWDKPIVEEEELAGKSGWDKAAVHAKERGTHLFQSLAPTPALDIIKGIEAYQPGGKPDTRARFKPRWMVAADVFGGVKIYPADYMDEFVRRINKQNPKNGTLATKLKGRLKTLHRQRDAVEKRGGNTGSYDEKITEIYGQLEGLASETEELMALYQKAFGGNQ